MRRVEVAPPHRLQRVPHNCHPDRADLCRFYPIPPKNYHPDQVECGADHPARGATWCFKSASMIAKKLELEAYSFTAIASAFIFLYK
jgi:hypothetical protein